MHRSVNKFRLRCGYRRTAVQIYFDCGAIFSVFQRLKKCLSAPEKTRCTSPHGLVHLTSIIYPINFTLCFFVATYALPQQGSDGTAYERSSDEYPNLCQCITTFEEGRTERTGRVDAGARVVDAYEVDEDEAQTDGQAGEVVRRTVGLRRSAQNHEHKRWHLSSCLQPVRGQR